MQKGRSSDAIGKFTDVVFDLHGAHAGEMRMYLLQVQVTGMKRCIINGLFIQIHVKHDHLLQKVRKANMRTFSCFSHTFHIFTCYSNSCTLVMLDHFAMIKRREATKGPSLLHLFTRWRLYTTAREFIRNMTIRNLCVKRCKLYENER